MNASDIETITAISHGWLAFPDESRGNGWHKYRRRNTSLWHTGRIWVSAELNDGKYENHRKYDTFAEAIEGEGN
jgi:hypothetical protein